MALKMSLNQIALISELIIALMIQKLKNKSNKIESTESVKEIGT